MFKDKLKYNVGTKPKNSSSEAVTIRDMKIKEKFIAKVSGSNISRLDESRKISY